MEHFFSVCAPEIYEQESTHSTCTGPTKGSGNSGVWEVKGKASLPSAPLTPQGQGQVLYPVDMECLV